MADDSTLKTAKRKAKEAVDDGGAKRAAPGHRLVNPKRVRELKGGDVGDGPVLYWMSRDQRVRDNWALLHAIEQAGKTGAPVAVVFNLVTAYLNAGARQFGFMLRGLQEVEGELNKFNIPCAILVRGSSSTNTDHNLYRFFMLRGDPTETVPKLVDDTGAALLVTDFGPLRLGREWRTKIADAISVPFHEVDTHNVVPCWHASDKKETAARTIRGKINRQLPEFLEDYPDVSKQAEWNVKVKPEPVDWKATIDEALERGKAVPEVEWCIPGEKAAAKALAEFVTKARLGAYEKSRNDPNADAVSSLSPYIHFGQLAPGRCALEAGKMKTSAKAAVDGFLEEIIVRRELADNFCYYEQNYDNIECAPAWARESLDKHRSDKREHLYTKKQLEEGKTYDELWNAAQLEMVRLGKMHGFMRMYWAKKILEWTESPDEALEISIYLNDRYELDGRDPNGYVGCAWSVCGIHDQGWGERPIFGKIRYMNYNGCKRKFDVNKYIAKIDSAIRELKDGKGTGPQNNSMLNYLQPKAGRKK